MASTESTENASPISPTSTAQGGKFTAGPPPSGKEMKTPFKESNPRDFMSPTDTLFSPCSQLLSKPKSKARKSANNGSMPKKLLTQRMKMAQEEAAVTEDSAPPADT